MPGPWITQPQLLSALADILKKDVGTMNAYWTTITTKRLQSTTSYLTNIMLSKAFTIQQIDSWDFIIDFFTDYCLYFCLVDGMGLNNYDADFVEKYNRAPELKAMTALSIGGIVTKPGASDGAGIEAGTMQFGSIRQFDWELRRRQWKNAFHPPL